MRKIITKCKIQNCKNLYDTYKGSGKGFCVKHYRRLQRNGHPLKKLYSGNGFVSNSYHYLSINGKRIKRSRHVMQFHIGRPLKSFEIVHHINENTLDDNINNLKIVSRSEHIKLHKEKLYYARWC